MRLARHIASLFEHMQQRDIDAMSPAERRRFADTCRHWADKADKQMPQPKEGVLADVRRYGVHAE